MFDCRVPALNRYFRELVGQDIKRGVTTCIVAHDKAGTVAGFNKFAAFSVGLNDLPESQRKKLPRYGAMPAALAGRLAVSISHQGTGAGSLLVLDAISRASPPIWRPIVFKSTLKTNRPPCPTKSWGLSLLSSNHCHYSFPSPPPLRRGALASAGLSG